MRLAALQFEIKLQKGIGIGITIIKIFIWGGISLDIQSEIIFTVPLACHCKTKFPTVYMMIPGVPKHMKRFESLITFDSTQICCLLFSLVNVLYIEML